MAVGVTAHHAQSHTICGRGCQQTLKFAVRQILNSIYSAVKKSWKVLRYNIRYTRGMIVIADNRVLSPWRSNSVVARQALELVSCEVPSDRRVLRRTDHYPQEFIMQLVVTHC